MTGQVLLCRGEAPNGCMVPNVEMPDGRRFAQSWLEVSRGNFIALDHATDEHYAGAAKLSGQRLRRCRQGSDTYWWHRCVIEEHNTRRRASMTLIQGGAA